MDLTGINQHQELPTKSSRLKFPLNMKENSVKERKMALEHISIQMEINFRDVLNKELSKAMGLIILP